MTGTDRTALADAYRLIVERAKERFDGDSFRRLYRHFFAAELTEDELDRHLVGYAKHADAGTMADYLRYLEYLDTRPPRKRRLPHN